MKKINLNNGFLLITIYICSNQIMVNLFGEESNFKLPKHFTQKGLYIITRKNISTKTFNKKAKFAMS